MWELEINAQGGASHFISCTGGGRDTIDVFTTSRILDSPNLNSQNINDTCAWTPNKVFTQFLLVSVETARVLLQSLWARLSTGASREAPVDNEVP